MRPAGNENKGAMKLRVDFKLKSSGDLILLFETMYVFGILLFISEFIFIYKLISKCLWFD